MEELQGAYDASSNSVLPLEHENPQSKPMMRKQDKRVTGRYVNCDCASACKIDERL